VLENKRGGQGHQSRLRQACNILQIQYQKPPRRKGNLAYFGIGKSSRGRKTIVILIRKGEEFIEMEEGLEIGESRCDT